MNYAKEEQKNTRQFCEFCILFYILIKCALLWSAEGHKGIFLRSIKVEVCVETIQLWYQLGPLTHPLSSCPSTDDGLNHGFWQ